MQTNNTEREVAQDAISSSIEIRPYTVSYDRGGSRRRHSFTRYEVFKDGRRVDEGLTRPQAERLQKTLLKGRMEVTVR